ncbi:MAG TPA: hypothetical protein PLG50_06990 [bacterium]|nr:hypothetical protein [bacterium]HQG45387.1 hypothetical protein [bacterium]HQI48924.1 hypothetical protein [bacterium]HQJ62972.1 hypothetical protein [bacterium]
MNKKWLLTGLALLWFCTACEIDHGLGLIESGISGRVIFLHPEKKPARVDAVRVVAVVNFPPQSLGDLVFTNTSINLSQLTPSYRLPAPLARYVLVGAIYREKGKEWDYAKILGFYGSNPDSNLYDIRPVTLSKAHPVAAGIDIYCDWASVPGGGR